MQKYKNKKVLIWGLGLNGGGLGMAKYFADKGAKVTVTDLKTKVELKQPLKQLSGYKNINYVLGKHRKKDFIENDIIVRNPAVPPNTKYEQIAKKHNKKIIIELLYVLENFPGKVIGVTGTKGKSTTTMLIYSVLKNAKKDVFVGGNLQTSTVEILDNANSNCIAVLEIPSFQLEYLDTIKKSPNIAVITNIKNDHVNWHGSLKNYQKAKEDIFKYQTKNDTCIVNLDDKYSKSLVNKIKGKVITVSNKDKTANIYLDVNFNIYLNGVKKINIKNSPIKGKYNLKNVCQAYAVCNKLKIHKNTFMQTLTTFKGIKNRQEIVGVYNGITYINDTTATQPDAMLNAIEAFKQDFSKKIIMISGGMDKSLDFSHIKTPLGKHLKALVLLEGTASEKINTELKTKDIQIFKYYNSMRSAVEKAKNIAKKGDLIILSPGAASFNMFKNEFDRGNKFVRAIKNGHK